MNPNRCSDRNQRSASG